MPLIQHYDFEQSSGPLTDQTENGDDSTSETVTSRSAEGVNGGSAWDFDGTDDGVIVPIPSHNEYTAACWIKFDDNSEIQDFMSTNNGGGDGWLFTIRDGNTLELLHGTGSAYTTAGTVSFPSTSKWWFVAGSWDGSTVRFYLDGVLDDEASQGSFNPGAGTDMGIGANYAGSRNCNCQMAEMWVFDHALPPQDIAYFYEVTQAPRYRAGVQTAP